MVASRWLPIWKRGDSPLLVMRRWVGIALWCRLAVGAAQSAAHAAKRNCSTRHSLTMRPFESNDGRKNGDDADWPGDSGKKGVAEVDDFVSTEHLSVVEAENVI